ncbi:M15 family metallopeptidase [Mycobacterium sp. TY814]|uniref:M15 family metallopeptidase n=1 Tax=unclassified Mycobacterium TaxID=2642494 RepID=UPI0027414E92|nr:M15 family metallopeptidase [Mycobacterium sp. TY814]MDP7721773.1 M15 family metallopeptidase [Mycobacterium sp. TY814]
MARRNVYGNDWSSNGWPMVDEGSCTWVTVPGTDVSLQIQNGQPLQILRAFAADFNAEVEPLRDADSACWTPGNSVADSNHLSGTAMDLNWESHPFRIADAGFDAAKRAKVRALLDWYEGMVFWGNDWTNPKDAMHFQLASLANGGNINTYGNPAVDDFIKRKIRPDGFSTRRGIGIPQPQQPPPAAPDARAAAITALYDAVPVIDEDRAAQLIDPMIAGLALAECNTVNRIAMALAQWGHESDGFATTEEYAKDGRYAPYIGRTWIQITWQANYAAFGRWAATQGLIADPNYFVDNPTALADLKWAGIGAAWYWTVARPTINSLSDQGDIVAVTQLINGGQNGIADRRTRYQQALGVGDRLLTLIEPRTNQPAEGPLMALTDDEQTELLAKVRYIFDQLGPKHPEWGPDSSMGVYPNGDEMTLRDGLAELKRKVDSPEVAIVTFQTEATP